jgi:eukaryotic-like serine/threonine-protein kinase
VPERLFNGRYRIIRHLARGGRAEVYLGQDELLHRPVAIKVLFPELAEDASAVARFHREAQAAASLIHPNIVSVYDVGEDGGSRFIVIEYVDGPTLREVIRTRSPMEPSEATDIAAAVAAALAVAHGRGIIHGDVKPDNVLMGGTVKVADFGIARAIGASDSLTAVIGAASYLSPEEAQGHAVDHRSDLYSLGMVLYEMLAGRPAFIGDSPVAILRKQLSEAPPPPSRFNPDVPPALDAVVARALSTDPAGRHASADELRAELVAVGNRHGVPDPTVADNVPRDSDTAVLQPLATSPGTGSEPAPDLHRKTQAPAAVYRRRRLAAVGLFVVLILAGIAVASVLGGSTTTTTTVPGVVGLSVADATSSVARKGLKVAVVGRDQPVPGDRVVGQNPAAGAKVAPNTTVSLVVSAATTTVAPTTVTMPATAPPSATTTAQAPSATTGLPATTSPPATVPVATTSPVPTTGLAPTTTRPL